MDDGRQVRISRRSLLGTVAASGAAMVAGTALGLTAAGPGHALAASRLAFPFQDPGVPLAERIDDLLGRLTREEKISLLHQYQPAVARLGLALVKNGTEALHGLAWSNDLNNNGNQTYATATMFPQAVGLGLTWDPDLVRQVGEVVGREARGYHSINPAVWGLNLWAPVVNLLRDPRWGRNEEGYSEDPYLTGVISTAYGAGIQGPDPDHLQAAPTLKHFLAYNNEARRTTSSATLPARVLREYDLEAFRPAIAADAATGAMTSYNLVNGRPATVTDLIGSALRTWSQRELMVVSDAFAPGNLTGAQQYYATAAQAAAGQVRAQMDSFTQDGSNAGPTIAAITGALGQGLITEADIDTNVRHVLSVRFRLGDFDPPGVNPYATITSSVINAPAHQALARRAVRAQLVLVKNDAGLLPLDPGRGVAVIGPLADQLFSDFYAGTMPYRITPVQGLGEAVAAAGGPFRAASGVDQVAYQAPDGRYVTASANPDGAQLTATAGAIGPAETFDLFDWGQSVFTLRAHANNRYWTRAGGSVVNGAVEPNSFSPQEPVRFVAQADGSVAIRLGTGTNNFVVVGAATGALTANGTAGTATRFAQVTVERGVDAAAAAAAGADAAVVLVGNDPLINGRETQDRADLDLSPQQQALIEAVAAANPRTVLVVVSSYPFNISWAQRNVPAILHSSHGGQEMGHGLADVLFGAQAPTGRLTQTWYAGAGDLPDIFDYDIIKGERTYLYYRGTALYPFGHGLTYTTFAYGNLRLDSGDVDANGTVRVSVEVTNTGGRDGDEVVQLYTHQHASRVKQPNRQLRGFQRVHIGRGRTEPVAFELRVADLALWDVTREKWTVESASHDVLVGRSSADIALTAQLAVHGEVIPPRDLSRTTRAANFDDYHGISLVDADKVSGDAVGLTHPGDWITFGDADLGGQGVSRFTASVAKADADAAAITIVLDDPVNGTVLGSVPVPGTGDRYAYTTITAPLTPATGRHNVYLVFTGNLNLTTFSLT